jgi:hypothetical protein
MKAPDGWLSWPINVDGAGRPPLSLGKIGWAKRQLVPCLWTGWNAKEFRLRSTRILLLWFRKFFVVADDESLAAQKGFSPGEKPGFRHFGL